MTTVELSALDHMYTGGTFNPVSFILRYDKRLDVSRLERAFRETVAKCVGASGCLVKVDEHTAALDLSCDRAEFQVTAGRGDEPIDSYIDNLPHSFGGPLTRARVTRLDDGGTAVGLSMSHVVADGYGFFLFLMAWAARARGSDFPELNCDRRTLTGPHARATHPELTAGALPASGYFVWKRELGGTPCQWESRAYAPPASAARDVSVNDLLAASLWKESLAFNATKRPTLCCLVDFRPLRRELGPFYFGNASLVAPISVDRDTLRDATVDDLARLIRNGVRACTKRVMPAVAELEGLRARYGLKLFESWWSMPRDGFVVTNLSKIPLASMDFGTGGPTAVDAAAFTTFTAGALVLQKGDALWLKMARP